MWAKAARASRRRVAAGQRAVAPQLVQHDRVVVGRGDDADVGVVLGGAAHHGRPADVDQLDRGVGGERVEVADHQVDGLDALGLEVGQVARARPGRPGSRRGWRGAGS